MKITVHRLNIFLWFLSRPSLYKQFFRELLAFLKRNEHPTLSLTQESLTWCEKLALDEKSAVCKINPDWSLYEFEKEYHELVDNGFKIIQSFEFNWGGQGNLSLNYSLAHHLKATRIIETGVAYGWSSLSLLKALDVQKKGKLVSTDMPFWGTKHEKLIGCVVPENLKKFWTLIRRPDRDAIPNIIKSNLLFDLCHYDSDKSYAGKKWALPKLWGILREGGILICDDINDNLAFKDFCEQQSIEPIIAKTFDSQVVKYVGIAVKVNGH